METMQITSAQNPTIKKFKNFNRRKTPNLLRLDGVHLHQEYLKVAQARLETTLVSTRFKASAQFNEFKNLENLIEIPDDLMSKISPTKHPAGILSLAVVPQIENQAQQGLNIILENLQDPGNMGTILRTCAAMNTHQVFLLGECTDIWSEKALRAGMGAQFFMPCQPLKNLNDLPETLSANLIATDLKGDSLWNTTLPKNAVFIFGNEGQGVSKSSLSQAQIRLKIPMNAKTESLNVASSVAILTHEWNRQQHRSA